MAENRPPGRSLMVLVGVSFFLVYTAAAALGFTVLGWLLANPPHPLVFLSVFAIATLFTSYIVYRNGTVQLIASLDAQPLSRERAPALYRRLERLCFEMNVEEPTILLADLEAPNALSLGGPRRGAIVLDRQLVRMLTIDELEGILAHELAHMESYDTFINTVALTVLRSVTALVFVFLLPFVIFLAGIDRAIGWITGRPRHFQFGLSGTFQAVVGMALLGLLSVVTLLFLAHSRRQEYKADSRAAAVTGNPVALARALSKIHRVTKLPRGFRSLLYIHDESPRQPHPMLSTHPPFEKRLDRLLEQAEQTRHQHVERLRPPG